MPGFLQSTRNLVASRVGGGGGGVVPDGGGHDETATNLPGVVKPSFGRRNTWTSPPSTTNDPLRRSSRSGGSSSILESCDENTVLTSSTRSDSLYDDRSRRRLRLLRQTEEEERRRRRESASAIRDRDETIASLERARLAELQTLSELRSTIDDLRREHRREIYWRDLDLDRLSNERNDLKGRLERMTRDLWDEDLVRGIAGLIKEGELGGGGGSGEDHHVGRHVGEGFDDVADGGGSDPRCRHDDNVSVMTDSFNYATKLQSKLCKAMHRMEVLSNQMDLVQRSCDESLRSLRKELNDVVEGRCASEVELLSRLDELEIHRRSSEEALRVKLECKERTIEELEDRLADLRDATAAATDPDRRRRFDNGTAGGAFEDKDDDRRELESAREEILMLQASNKIKQRRIDQLTEERQQGRRPRRKRAVDDDDEENPDHEDDSTKSIDTSDPVGSDDDYYDDDDDFAYSDLGLGPAEAPNVLSIVTRIARVTSHMEKDVKAGLVRRGEMLKTLNGVGDIGDDGEKEEDGRKMAREEEYNEGSEDRSSSYRNGGRNDERRRSGRRSKETASASSSSGPPMTLDIRLARRGSM